MAKRKYRRTWKDGAKAARRSLNSNPHNSPPAKWDRLKNQPKIQMPTETKPKRKANPALLKPVQPDAVLAAVVGSTPVSRGELTKKVWDYIKKHKLQDEKKRTLINADAALKAVFGGKAQVTMFEMTKLVSGHVK